MFISKLLRYILIIIVAPLTSSAMNIQEEANLKKELVTIIKEAHTAKVYWEHVKHTPITHALTNITTFGIQTSWKQEIQKKQKNLEKLITETAELLGQLEQSSTNKQTHAKNKKVINHKKSILKQHDIPSHFARRWPTYTLAGISGCLLYYLTTQTKTIGSLQNNSKEIYNHHIKNVIDDIKQHLEETRAQNKHLQSNKDLYIETGNVIEEAIITHPEFKELLQNIPLEILQNPTSSLSAREQVIDQINNTLMNNFLKQLPSLQPLQPSAPTALTSTLEHNLAELNKTVNQLKQHIEFLNSKKVYPKNPTYVEQGAKNFLDGITQQEDVVLILNQIKIAVQNIANITTMSETSLHSHKESINQLLSQVGPLSQLIRQFLETSHGATPTVKLIAQCTQAKFQYYEILGLQGMYKSQFPLMMLGTVPAGLLCYGAYKGVQKTWHALTNINWQLCKKQMICYQLHLNRYRTTPGNQLSDLYYGMSYYWIAQLNEYSSLIPHEHTLSYEQYLMELSDHSMTPEQKIMVIESMFREYDFLQ